MKRKRRFRPVLWFLRLLSNFDWITPLKALYEDVERGGPVNLSAWSFFVPSDEALDAGWSSAHINELLTQNGIDTWGKLDHLGSYGFSTRLNQAASAERILEINGIPIHAMSAGAPHVEGEMVEFPRNSLSSIVRILSGRDV